MIPTRICKSCQQPVLLDDCASYKRNGEIRYLHRCKECHREKERDRQRSYIERNRDKHNKRIRERKKERYQEDSTYRERLRASSKQYYEEHKKEILEKKKEEYHRPYRPKLTPRDRYLDYDDELQDELAKISNWYND